MHLAPPLLHPLCPTPAPHCPTLSPPAGDARSTPARAGHAVQLLPLQAPLQARRVGGVGPRRSDHLTLPGGLCGSADVSHRVSACQLQFDRVSVTGGLHVS